jgi:hypothetical protein
MKDNDTFDIDKELMKLFSSFVMETPDDRTRRKFKEGKITEEEAFLELI